MESTPGPSRPSASSNQPPKPRRKVNQRVTLPGTGRFSADESLDRVPAQSIHRNSDLVITTPSNAPSFQFKPLITPLSAVHPSSSRTQPTTRVKPDPFLAASHILEPDDSFTQLEEPFPSHKTESESMSVRKRNGRSTTTKIHDHLRSLGADKISPLDVLVQTLDLDSSEDLRYRKNLYSADDPALR
ncbi:hypothetical protein B0H13DRAFT_2303419 [Mycena leptocephala]|nr:hypothetical protein B0H13DRAFT_2303419 [Mycena leptocephala]